MLIGATGLRGFPDVMGGIERHCEELYPRVRKLRPDLEICCVARRPYVESGKAYEFEGVQIVPLPSTRKSSVEALLNTGMAVGYFGLFRRPALLHIHGIGPALFSPIAKILGLPLVVTHHGKDYRRAKWNGLAKAIIVAGERMAMRFADRIVAVSESLAVDLRREFPRAADKIVYIPNGVPDIPKGRPEGGALLSRFGLESGGYIVSVGRLVPEKGFEDLVAAHLQSNSPLPLVIVGGADHETDFVRSLRAKASDRIRFTGALPRADVLTLCGHAACFVLASHHEGLPIAALEAAAAGAPLLLSEIEANVDVKLPARNYFPVGNVTVLAERLASGFDGLDQDNDAVVARFDWGEIARQTAELYSDLYEQSHRVAGSTTKAG